VNVRAGVIPDIYYGSKLIASTTAENSLGVGQELWEDAISDILTTRIVPIRTDPVKARAVTVTKE
jgi:hypothetical protein